MKENISNTHSTSNAAFERLSFRRGRPTKKSQILELWQSGLKDIRHIALDLSTTPSYVASVLQEAHLIEGYYDLYTSSEAMSLNIYSQEIKEKLGYKTPEVAARSVEILESEYYGLGEIRDRAGQHHCMMLALTLFNRARFMGKLKEAEYFKQWLIQHLNEQPLKRNF